MNYGALNLLEGDGGSFWVLTGCPPHVCIRLKQLFPRIPKAQRDQFMFKRDLPNAADIAWFIDRYPVDVSAADRAFLDADLFNYRAEMAERERIFAPDYTPPPLAGLQLGQEVRGYQAQAVELLRRSRGLLLGDDVGLGKTYTAAAAMLTEGALPAVVVCQPHLQKQWASVIETFTTLRTYEVPGTRAHTLPPADVYIFRYTQILGWIDTFRLLNPGLVVFDEIQELRTGQSSQKGQAAMVLARAAGMRLGLTATPIYNYGVEIWTIMRYLAPDALGGFDDFIREWIGGAGRVIRDPEALGTYLRDSHVFLRRRKRDVGQDMPPVNRIVDTIDYDADVVNSVEALARQLAHRATTGEFTERGKATRELDLLLRHATGVAKAPHVARFVRILVDEGEPVVLFGWHREVYEIWNREFADLKPAMYTGTESPAQKEREKNRFLTGETPILIMSLRSGAGLDGLQRRCSTAVFGELDWSPGVHHQCVGRLDREHQTQPVTAIFLVTNDGSDPPMMDVLGLKASQAQQIVDPGLGVVTQPSDAAHLRKLVQRYLKKREAA